MSKKITIIGTGYVGLVSAAVFADWGNDVMCLDINEKKIENIKNGIMPIYEEGLEELVDKVIKNGNFIPTTNYEEAINHAELIFICVGTPSNQSGAADLSYVFSAAESIAKYMKSGDYKVIVTKSTVPVHTNQKVFSKIKDSLKVTDAKFDVASNPEFLREGTSIHDANNPDRVVIGSESEQALKMLEELYSHLNAKIVKCDLSSAELIKYASNAFLATKIAFINEVSQICERTGADIKSVAYGMGLDNRIGPKFLNAGIGYGGSCFKPDTFLYVKNSPDLKNITINDLVKKENEGKYINALGFDLVSRKASISKVSALTIRDYNGDMVKIKTEMGREVEVTADHPMIVFSDGEFNVKQAKDINIKDEIPFTSKLPELEPLNKKINLIDIISNDKYLCSKTVIQANNNTKDIAENYNQIKEYAHKHLKYVHDIKRYNQMPLRVYLDLPEYLKSKINLENCVIYTATTKVPALIPINKMFMRYLGYFISEGCIAEDKGRNNVIRKRIMHTFNINETDFLADIENFYNLNGIKFMIRKSQKNHSASIIVSSNILAKFLLDHLNIGSGSYSKRLPKLAFRLSEELKIELLRGIFSGDGSLSESFGKYPYIEYATVSKPLANDILLMLQSLGVVGSIRHRMMNKSTVEAHIIRISGKVQIEKLKEILGDIRRSKIEEKLEEIKYIKPIGYKHLENFNLIAVKSVESYAYAGPVYSIESSESTVVVNSGLIVHNCFPKDVEALYRTSSENLYDFRLLRGVMDANARQKHYFFEKVISKYGENLAGLKFGILGAAFKNGTDDVRKSPAIEIIRMLKGAGASMKLYDPAALENSKHELGNDYLEFCENYVDVFDGVDAIIILTEWKDFATYDYKNLSSGMKTKVIFDGRNLLDRSVVKNWGFEYYCVGR